MSGHYLSTPLRRALEKSIRAARQVAEDGARDAIRRLGVADPKPPSYLGDREKELRRRLRAHARALGDAFDKAGDKQETRKLVEATAYAHWHRMLFARFLAERNLLRHPTLNAPITIEECRELAAEEGLQDAWAVAERYAAAMLPAVFRIDDPVLLVELDPAHTQKLTALVTGFDSDTFQAEDSLGWTYQYWRAAEKEAVNDSGVKIGADELAAVTQLFTEPYMVRFLLHNTLGAWWAGKRLAADPQLAAAAKDEDELRFACSLPSYSFEMLRFVREGEDGPWRPAAGTYAGWPAKASDLTVLDPCCGSGHFLTETLAILTALRQEEESISEAQAVASVLRDNLHGLEIDGLCVQIAAFAVALTSWRIGGWQLLPRPHIAWVGAPPPLARDEFVSLAGEDKELARALSALHELFVRAPILGSLLQPTGGDLVDPVRIANLEVLLEKALKSARRLDPESQEGIVSARGMADAALLLQKRFILQATNVPFLAKSKLVPEASDYIDAHLGSETSDLYSAFILRMRLLSAAKSTIAVVTPQNWYGLKEFRHLRSSILEHDTLLVACDLGPAAFRDMNWWAQRTALTIISPFSDNKEHASACVDAEAEKWPDKKAENCRTSAPRMIKQSSFTQGGRNQIAMELMVASTPLGQYASCLQGISSGDNPRLVRMFWELAGVTGRWRYFHSPPMDDAPYSGMECAINWGDVSSGFAGSAVRGDQAWKRRGIIFGQMRHLPFSHYTGELFSNSAPALIPHNEADRPAICAFVWSGGFLTEMRKINRKTSVDNGYFEQVGFDLPAWRARALAMFPNGLPEPQSDNPTQWLFHGNPQAARPEHILHVALARLAGYRWPSEIDTSMRLAAEARKNVDAARKLPTGAVDGIMCLPSIAGEPTLADRLRQYLTTALGQDWSDATERRLVAAADEAFESKQPRDTSLEGWLQTRAFRQHHVIFHQRPIIWHISDGFKDGFSAVVHYHRFDQAALRKLTYTILGDWLTRAKHDKNDLRYEKGRELQQKLEKILEGEKPYDIFVRWKSLAEQPLGWDPDLDDGVRLNIRPFVEAGVLRDTPKIKWTKDRGADVASAPWYDLGPRLGGKPGDRINDHHTTLAEKRAAREALKAGDKR